jgi:hypothetical protein
MKLKRLDFRDVYGFRNPDLILTRENLMERVMLLITAYFWMGTELRFLKQMMVEGFEDSIDSEFWHGKALELAIRFLPGDAPLVKHIVSSYSKHHSPSLEQIPEDQEVDSEVRIIRPNEGITYNKLAPWIRNIEKPSVKLAPLDLAFNWYSYSSKLKTTDLKLSENITECLKDSKSTTRRNDTPDTSRSKKINNTIESSNFVKSDKKEKSTDSKRDQKENMKIMTDDQMAHAKMLISIDQLNSLGSKESRDSSKAFIAFKATSNQPQSKTIDPDLRKTVNTSSSIKSISPSSKTLKNRMSTILRTRTEETTLNSINNSSSVGNNALIDSRGKPGKSTSNERSKSKKKNGSKERIHVRPKTSKGQRKDPANLDFKNKLFKKFYNNKKEQKKFKNLNANINNLLTSNSQCVTTSFPNGFIDRPSSVIENNRKGKMTKITEHRDKFKKVKGGKNTRGGTPAPPSQNRSQANNTLTIKNSASGFIERSASNECIGTTSRFNHHTTQGKTRKGSAKKQKSKFNANIEDKNNPQISKSWDRKCRSESRSKVDSFSDKRYQVQPKYALILQNRNTDVNSKTPFLNINESNINITNTIDSNLIELYTKAQNFPTSK